MSTLKSFWGLMALFLWSPPAPCSRRAPADSGVGTGELAVSLARRSAWGLASGLCADSARVKLFRALLRRSRGILALALVFQTLLVLAVWRFIRIAGDLRTLLTRLRQSGFLPAGGLSKPAPQRSPMFKLPREHSSPHRHLPFDRRGDLYKKVKVQHNVGEVESHRSHWLCGLRLDWRERLLNHRRRNSGYGVGGGIRSCRDKTLVCGTGVESVRETVALTNAAARARLQGRHGAHRRTIYKNPGA